MASENNIYYKIGYDIRKRLGKNLGALTPAEHGIYRIRHIGGKTRQEKLKFYKPKNPRTAEQQMNRAKFRHAIEQWQELSSPEKETWRNLARKYNIPGYNYFVKLFMQNYNFIFAENNLLILQENGGGLKI